MPPSTDRSAPRLLADAALALLAACGALALFVPPFAAGTLDSWPRALLAGLAAALALPLHWLLLAAAARRLGLRVAGWLGLSVLLFPVGSAAALLLLATGLASSPPAKPAPAAP